MSRKGTIKERVVTLSVEPGLFVLRYVSSPGPTPPSVFVRPSPSSEDVIEIISAPDVAGGLLERPGAALVVRAAAEGAIQLTISGDSVGDLDAKVQMEAIGEFAARPVVAKAPDVTPALDREMPFTPASTPVAVVREPPLPGVFNLLAHVSRRGDVPADSGDWIAGPSAPAPIEGLQINWVPPEGVALEYQVLVAGAKGRWSTWVFSGEYAGSRGRALALAGLRLRLVGPRAREFALEGEALFLGASPFAQQGQELAFVSATGSDPLVGLRLRLTPRAENTIAESAGADRGRVRIFRSGRTAEAAS